MKTQRDNEAQSQFLIIQREKGKGNKKCLKSRRDRLRRERKSRKSR